MNRSGPTRRVWRSPLARRLIIGVIFFSSTVTLVLTSLQLYGEYRESLGGIESELKQIEQVHLKALTHSLWATNVNDLTLQLEGIVQVPNFEYVAVHEEGRLWAKAGVRAAGSVVERLYPLVYRHRDEERRIGTLTVVASLDAVYRHLLERAVAILASNAFKTFLVAGFIFLFFHWLVNRHLLSIAQFLHSLDMQGQLVPLALARPARRKPDELDELAAAVNRMQENVWVALRALNESEQRFRAIADNTHDWESWLRPDGRAQWVNPAVERLTGYGVEECLTMPEYPLPMVHEEDRTTLQAILGNAIRARTSGNDYTFRIRHKNGEARWMAMSWQPIHATDGEHLGIRASVRDIGERKQMELVLHDKVSELALAEEQQRRLYQQAHQEQARIVSLLAAMNIGILFEDAANRIIYYNPAFRRIWLIQESVDLVGHATSDVLNYSANVLARPDHFSKHILQVPGTHEVSETTELVMVDGRVITQVSYPVRDQEGRFIGRLWLYEDVTRERQTAEQLIYLAERDSLTGLYNRHRFQEELGRMLAGVARRPSHGALLFFDLDEFKYVNDTFGHRAGDSMLIRVAGEVSALVRGGEMLARLGGDEFAVLMPEADEAQAVKLADRIIRAIGQVPFRFDSQNLRLTTSLGIALYPRHGSSTEDLIAHADAAMYQAKEAGKNAWRVYREDRDASREMLHRLTWNERIGNALENDLLRLHFQGVYRAADGELAHLEALVRMQDETDASRIIMPGHFITAAERTGKILGIDRWVIRESVRLLARSERVPPIAVNISGRSFDDPSLPQYITDLLAEHRVAPARLTVELTETSAVSDLHDAQRFIEALHTTGCRVCLDDFGNGFSSFAYLKHLNVDHLKIDGLFIRDLPHDRDNQVFVKAIVDVARGMRKKTVAEFVEDEETRDMLTTLGVDMLQGYYLDMPQACHPALKEFLA